jgi:hypothetical protein
MKKSAMTHSTSYIPEDYQLGYPEPVRASSDSKKEDHSLMDVVEAADAQPDIEPGNKYFLSPLRRNDPSY